MQRFESFSNGAGWCQALSDCSVDLVWMFSQVLASLRDRHLGPPMMGSGGCGGPISRRVLAVRLTAGIRTRNGLASSIVPCGDIAPPVGGIHVSPSCFYCAQVAVRYDMMSVRTLRSCRRSFFPGPAKLGAIHPHAMHDRQPSRYSDDRALHPTMPGNLHAPGLEPRPPATVGH